jgi:predicted ATPase
MAKHKGTQPSIRGLTLKHFRAFADSEVIPMRPLTLIFGKNNSGKSTILHSLLLLKQTIELPEYGPRLNTHGRLAESGSFNDLVHMHRGTNFEWHLEITTKDGHSAWISMGFVRDEKGQLARISYLQVQHPSIDVLEFKRGPGAGGPYELRIGNVPLGGQEKANFQFSAARFFPLIGEEPPKVGAPNRRRAQARAVAAEVLDTLETMLRNLRTVGAFRMPPQSRYEYFGKANQQADPTGEYVVQALIQDASRSRKGELIGAVNRWLSQVGHVKLLPIRKISSTLFELRLKDTDSGRWANYAHVGYGIGQALPVLVEGLRTPEAGLFLVQEPEIHLHPDAQLAMADFLVDLALAGRQVIVETHSEAILLRARHRLLDKTEGRRLGPSDMAIVVVEKSTNGSSIARSVEADKLGQLESWPKGFMEDVTRERLDFLSDAAQRAED